MLNTTINKTAGDFRRIAQRFLYYSCGSDGISREEKLWERMKRRTLSRRNLTDA